MKILFTTESYYPDMCGVSNVVTKLAEGLSSIDHDVTVFTEKRDREFSSHNGVKIIEFNVKGNVLSGYKGEVEKYKNSLLAYDGDVVINECAQIWSSDLAFDILDNLKLKKVFHSHGY